MNYEYTRYVRKWTTCVLNIDTYLKNSYSRIQEQMLQQYKNLEHKKPLYNFKGVEICSNN